MSQLIVTSARRGGVVTGRRLGRTVRSAPAATIGAAIITGFVVVALAAPLIEPFSPVAESCQVFAHPSPRHWLGCDDGGIDVLSELIQGGRVSMIVGVTATLVSMLIGGGIGLAAGYFGGAVDTILMRVTDYFLVVPVLVLMIVVAEVWGPSLFHVIIVIGALLWTSTARVIRAQVKSVKERTYVTRVRSIGAGHGRILWRHIVPQVGPLVVANTVLTIGVAIFFETALAFLGLSDPTQVTWGKIIEFAFLQNAVSVGAWWVIVPPGVCITLLVIGCFLVGQAIEDALNPRLRVAHVSVTPWRWRAHLEKLGER
jgi:peptide/nickel transport system permease protein